MSMPSRHTGSSNRQPAPRAEIRGTTLPVQERVVLPDPVLVTGASGFIGRHVVRQLVDQGLRVRALVREEQRIAPSLHSRVTLEVGDLTHRPSLERAMDGARTVLHLAACARAWVRDRAEYERVNVEAVNQLLELAQEARIARLTHVSTILTLPPYRAAAVNHGAQRPTPYERTKRAGEALVERYAAEGNHAVIVHPTRVYGPGPLTDANAVTKSIVLHLRGRLRVRLNDGGALGNYVHAEDVARGIILAAERGKRATHYVIGGENASFQEFIALVEALAGRHRWMITLPTPVAIGVGVTAEWWGRLSGNAPFTARWVRSLLEDRRARITAARTDLDYTPRSLARGLKETMRWLRAEGHIPD